MLTDSVWAYEVAEGDFLVIDGEVLGKVDHIDDEGDTLLFSIHDEDGDLTQYPFGPFAGVAIVLSFEDEEEDLTVYSE
jgi:hypothetical protein